MSNTARKTTRSIVFIPSTKQPKTLTFSPVGALVKAIAKPTKRKRKTKATAKPTKAATVKPVKTKVKIVDLKVKKVNQKPTRATSKVKDAPAKGKAVKPAAQVVKPEPKPAPTPRVRKVKPVPLKRACWPDGRVKAIEGEEVYRLGSGFGNTPATQYGVVYKGRRDKLRVRVTGEKSLFHADGPSNKTFPLTPAWTVKNDPWVQAQEENRRANERFKQQAAEAAAAARRHRLAEFKRRYGTLAIAEVKPGDVLVHFEGAMRCEVVGFETFGDEGPWVMGYLTPEDKEAECARCVTTAKGLHEWRKLDKSVQGSMRRPGVFHITKGTSGIFHVYPDAIQARAAVERCGHEERGTVQATDYFDAVQQAMAMEAAEYPTMDARMRGMSILKKA